MGWGMLAAVLEHMADRLRAGARADLLDLARITYVKSRTARVLWENGFRSVRSVAEAAVGEIVPVLLLVRDNESPVVDEVADELQYIGTAEEITHCTG